jgi:hypothetical protein
MSSGLSWNTDETYRRSRGNDGLTSHRPISRELLFPVRKNTNEFASLLGLFSRFWTLRGFSVSKRSRVG